MTKTRKPDEVVEQTEKAGERSTPKKPLVEIPGSISVRQLADLFQVSAIDIIKQLMRKGIMANINQVIGYETAAVVATNLGYEVKQKARVARKPARKVKKELKEEESAGLKPRPPVVTIMGHVDHGKTRLLDAIRQTNVMDTEAGNITQHIGAYQVDINGQKITFLDTPGHEAFTAMRARGAQITDITVLVVAADDGVMPQTVEAINHAKAAGVPIVVAINKIDKPEANTDKVKQQLSEFGLVVEEWGGDIVCVPVSAKEKTGISDLLENILVVAEIDDLKANPSLPAAGVVIEAEMDRTRGPLSTVLIQNGTLRLGDTIVVGTTWGRVRAMFNDMGKRVRKAEPSTPVEILGLNEVSQVGDALNVVPDESKARELIQKRLEERAEGATALRLENISAQITAGKVKELNIILKADVQGSTEPIRTSLERLSSDDVKLRLIHSGTGNVAESDVMLAIASNALIIGFNVSSEASAQRLAKVNNIDIRYYNIIYNLIDDVDKALKGMLEPTYVEVVEGRAEVRAIFPAGKGVKAAGVYVTEGKITRNASVRVIHAGEKVFESKISSLKRFKDDVKEVATGFECGVGIQNFNDFQVGDVLEFFSRQKT